MNRKICRIETKAGERKIVDCMHNHHAKKTNGTFVQTDVFDEALEKVMQVDPVALIEEFINTQRQALQVKDFKIDESRQQIEALEEQN